MTNASKIHDIQINVKRVSGFYLFMKRLSDIFVSLILILLLSWFLLIVLIINCFPTKFHPIFVDARIGKNGKEIKIFKFRSMVNDAESNIDEYLDEEQRQDWEDQRKVDDDPRIHKTGGFLRKTSIDELPQLFNILFGSMSLVGPRPMTKREVYNNYSEEQIKILLSTRPGLTGTWQVYGRESSEFKSGRRQKLDLMYFEKRSYFYDIKILFKTIGSVVKQKGAH